VEEILSDVPITKGAKEVVAELKKHDFQTAIISCGIEVLANRVAEELGILRRLLEENDIAKEECVAVGNSYGDAAMFEVCGLGIAFNPQDETVRKKADVVVEGDDLKGILGVIIGS